MNQPLVQALEWDSNFLGFPVGRLAAQQVSATCLDTIVAQSRQAGMRLIYLVVDPDDAGTATAASRAGAWLADRKVTFARATDTPLAPSQPTAAGSGTVFNTATFTPQLEQLAWQSGAYSRFRLDAQFAPHVFTDLYTQWLRASLTGELARAVLAYPSPTGKEVGLLTLGQQGESAGIGLLAVAGESRGQGIGQQLVEAARQQAQRWGCPTLQVVTQRANERACRFYARCGFGLVREEHIYHLWL